MSEHDHSYKLLFSHPQMVRDLLEGFIPGDWLSQFDYDSLQKVSGSYVSDDLRDRADDIVWRARWGDGWIYVYLLIDDGRLPPVLPIVLYGAIGRSESDATTAGACREYRMPPRPDSVTVPASACLMKLRRPVCMAFSSKHCGEHRRQRCHAGEGSMKVSLCTGLPARMRSRKPSAKQVPVAPAAGPACRARVGPCDRATCGTPDTGAVRRLLRARSIRAAPARARATCAATALRRDC